MSHFEAGEKRAQEQIKIKFENAGIKMNNVKYVVKDNHTLGYMNPGNKTMGVLSSSIDGHNPINGPVSISGASIRPATAQDFKRFRVAVPPDFK